jgi:hypothetical protein
MSRWEDLVILKRSSLVTVLLLVATLAVSARTYLLWKEGQWNLPTPVKRDALIAVTESKPDSTPRPLANTDVIVSRNLFDPERGASGTKEAEADSRALQRIRSFVLLGTAILGSNRYAILQDGGLLPPGRDPAPLRFNVGDVVEGFSLSEIRDKDVVFSKGASRIELALNYFRKVDGPAQGRVPTTQPGVAEAVSVPAQAEAVSVPAQAEAVSVPAQAEAVSVPARVRPVSPVVQRVLPQLPGLESLPASPTQPFPQQNSSTPSPSQNAPLLPEIPPPHR